MNKQDVKKEIEKVRELNKVAYDDLITQLNDIYDYLYEKGEYQKEILSNHNIANIHFKNDSVGYELVYGIQLCLIALYNEVSNGN